MGRYLGDTNLSLPSVRIKLWKGQWEGLLAATVVALIFRAVGFRPGTWQALVLPGQLVGDLGINAKTLCRVKDSEDCFGSWVAFSTVLMGFF